jgi:hypothetical protein
MGDDRIPPNRSVAVIVKPGRSIPAIGELLQKAHNPF